jgi:hypothetical protein
MRSISVFYGLVLAVVFAIFVPLSLEFFSIFFRAPHAVRISLAVTVILYAVAIGLSTNKRSGRLFALVLVSVLQILILVFYPPFLLYVVCSVGLLWLARALVQANSINAALLDLFLVFLALFVAIAVAKVTGSLALATWCFMLLLAAGALLKIPENKKSANLIFTQETSRFERAHRSAENALRALAEKA